MPETLDPRGVRFTAAMTCVILSVALITESWRVMAAQMVLFGLCAFVGLRLNPWGVVFRQAVAPRIEAVEQAEREAPAPVRFSQAIGFTFALVATIGYAAGWTTIGITANVLALIAAFLNAAFGYCLGCRLYPVVRLLVPAGSPSDTR
ncbi:DUF4395 domain-containing protein [Parasphingorhabdus pacifica]